MFLNDCLCFRGDYFPASGVRHRETVGLVSVGLEGDCRSSSSLGASSINGGYLAFNSSSVFPMYIDYRANGFSVRCVQVFIE